MLAIAVLPSKQGEGVGAAIVQELEAVLRGRGTPPCLDCRHFGYRGVSPDARIFIARMATPRKLVSETSGLQATTRSSSGKHFSFLKVAAVLGRATPRLTRLLILVSARYETEIFRGAAVKPAYCSFHCSRHKSGTGRLLQHWRRMARICGSLNLLVFI